VAEIDAHELRGEVEVAFAVSGDEVAAFGVDHVGRVPAFLEAPGAVVEAFGGFGDVQWSHGGVGHARLLRWFYLTSFFSARGISGLDCGLPRSARLLHWRPAHQQSVGDSGNKEADEPGVVVEPAKGRQE